MSNIHCYLNQLGVICSAGSNADQLHQTLLSGSDCLSFDDNYGQGRLPLGAYLGELPSIPLAEVLWQTRNNQFALAALQQMQPSIDAAIERYGASRIGVVVGTSTSGIAESERGIAQQLASGVQPQSFHYSQQEMGASAEFIARICGITGPCYGISTACSSGAKALASARRLIQLGLCDVVIAGGVDTLCQLTVRGFSSLEAVSDKPCAPFSAQRCGINIGEGAALFLVSKTPSEIALLGVGESSDAHHISAPEPEGVGAKLCMQAALDDAKLSASQIDYLNLHGTATPLNDSMESKAVSQLFANQPVCSSTKTFTGHTLGAAGAVEAAISYLAIERGFYPAQHRRGSPDSSLPKLNIHYCDASLEGAPQRVLSNSFAFGGNNIAIILGKAL